MSDSFSFDGMNVSGGQNVFGKNEGGMHQHIGTEPPTVEKVVEAITESLPPDTADFVMPELSALAFLPREEQEKPEVQERILAVCEAIRPHAGTVWKNLAVFGAAALESMALRNPIINGIVHVCKANQSETH